MTKLIDQHVPKYDPKSSKRKEKKNVWMTKHTVKKIKERSKKWERYRKYPTDDNYKDYKIIRNKVNFMIREDKDRYRKNILSSFKENSTDL